jgi:PIN domain nuclease of toxin-antitoxin system
MRILLDTHILVWAVAEPERLDAEATQALKDGNNEVLFSAVSIWEVAIKYRLGRPDFRREPNDIERAARRTGFIELPLRAATAARVAVLPLIHRDPFDRLLIAQAMAEPAIFYTADADLPAYSDLVRLIDAR